MSIKSKVLTVHILDTRTVGRQTEKPIFRVPEKERLTTGKQNFFNVVLRDFLW